MNWFYRIAVIIFGVILMNGCGTGDGKKLMTINREPVVEPDYSGVTIPVNIAPLNFKIKEDGTFFRINAVSSNGNHVKVTSSDGVVRFPLRSWKKLLKGSQNGKIEVEVIAENKYRNATKYNSFNVIVADEPMDPYICYRLLNPGYEIYLQLKIIQRSVSDFRETSVVENQLLDNNCINCHSFNRNRSDKFLFHVRGSKGGTYFVEGEKIKRINLKTSGMKYGAVYPAWHPGGRYVAFSSNNIVQSFHASTEENIEVTDLASSLILYDTERNEMSSIAGKDTSDYMDTFPEWSPDGKYVYFCRAPKYKKGIDFRTIKYDMFRRSFDPEAMTFGDGELVFDARSVNKSVSFPRVSPDGKYLVFTLHNFGNFSIWHKEADLYVIELMSGKTEKMPLNSDETESYHSWSSNGKWLVFSSKRGDGLTARPYFAYFNSPDDIGKPFVLPQKDPTLYDRMILTFNKPEFLDGYINQDPRSFERASKKAPLNARWSGDE